MTRRSARPARAPRSSSAVSARWSLLTLRDPSPVAITECRRRRPSHFKVASLPSPRLRSVPLGRLAGVSGSVNQRIPQGGTR
jgi:hypothetical protein